MKYNIPKIKINQDDIILTDDYQEVIAISSNGILDFFQIEFSTSDWIIEMVLDGNSCFELAGADIQDFTLNQAGAEGSGTPIVIKLGGKILSFCFDNFIREKIFFDNSLIINAKKTSSCTVNRSLLTYKSEIIC